MPGKVPRGSFQPPEPGPESFPQHLRFVLDQLNRGVILLGADGRVVDANACALALIRARDGLAVRHGRLAFSDKAVNGRVAALLETMTPPGEAPVINVSAQIKRPGGERPHRVVVLPIPRPADDSAMFVVFVYPGSGAARVSRDLLKQLYSFTRAEADVASELFAGHSVEQVARTLHVSPNTVRTHLKRIFSKCEVQSQAELMHVLSLGPLAP
ncbi:MAG TPA: LuxR C-terminal-related transcriptional regulator [Steroidobacteraceae bacterium]|nr:LuxR C-terminal-related transcriptional regulator [Steroidobacteraceae bacterium]